MEYTYPIKDKHDRPYTLKFKIDIGYDTPQEGKYKCLCNEIENSYHQLEPDKELDWQMSKKIETLLLYIRCDFQGFPQCFAHVGTIDLFSITVNSCTRTYGYIWIFDLNYFRLDQRGLSGSILKSVDDFLKERKIEYLCGITTEKLAMRFWEHMGYIILNDREIYKKLISIFPLSSPRPSSQSACRRLPRALAPCPLP